MATTNSYISIDLNPDFNTYNNSPNLAIYLELLDAGALSKVTKEMFNAIIDNIYELINWEEFKTFLSYTNDDDKRKTADNFPGFKNLYVVSELDKYNPVGIKAIEDIMADEYHHLDYDFDMWEGWAVLCYIRAYLQDIESGTVTGSFLEYIQ